MEENRKRDRDAKRAELNMYPYFDDMCQNACSQLVIERIVTNRFIINLKSVIDIIIMHKIMDFFDNNRIAAVLLMVLLILVAWILYKKYTHESFCSVKSHDEITIDKFIDMYEKPRKQIKLQCDVNGTEYYLSLFDPKYFPTTPPMYDCDGIALVLMEENDVKITNAKINSIFKNRMIHCKQNKISDSDIKETTKELDKTFDSDIKEMTGEWERELNKTFDSYIKKIIKDWKECERELNKTKLYPSEFKFTLNPSESDDDIKRFILNAQLEKIVNAETNEVASMPVTISFSENTGNFLCGTSKPTENFSFELVPVSLNGDDKFRLKIRLPDRVAYVGYSGDTITVDGGTDYQGINKIKRVVLCQDGDKHILTFSPVSS